jgi:hypothetical protein
VFFFEKKNQKTFVHGGPSISTRMLIGTKVFASLFPNRKDFPGRTSNIDSVSEIFFFHHPKAAGTAVARAMSSRFAGPECCPLIENTQRDHENRAGQYGEFKGYRYYGGHYGHDIYAAVAAGHATVGNFRDPVARLLSLYNYYRLHVTLPDDPAAVDALYPVAMAQRLGFREFVLSDDPRLEVHTRNHQVRQLTSSAWDIRSVGDLGHATGMMERMIWFYVSERPVESQRWGRAVFGDGFAAVERENVTVRRSDGLVALARVDAETRGIIRRKNALDLALYARAKARLLREADGGFRRLSLRAWVPWG